MEKSKVLRAANLIGRIGLTSAGSKLVSTAWVKLWSKQLTDDEFKANHPVVYALRLILIMLIGGLLVAGIVMYPVSKLYEIIDKKIDKMEHDEKCEETIEA